MYLLRQISLPNSDIREFCIYKHKDGILQQENTFSITNTKTFYTYLKAKQICIDYAIIHLETLCRNTLYELYPYIQIAISQEALHMYMCQLLMLSPEIYEEVAISLEYGKRSVVVELLNFIDMFYRAKTKGEAYFYYAKWQYERPLNEKKLTKFIRHFEFYLNEILNYIDLRVYDQYTKK